MWTPEPSEFLPLEACLEVGCVNGYTFGGGGGIFDLEIPRALSSSSRVFCLDELTDAQAPWTKLYISAILI